MITQQISNVRNDYEYKIQGLESNWRMEKSKYESSIENLKFAISKIDANKEKLQFDLKDSFASNNFYNEMIVNLKKSNEELIKDVMSQPLPDYDLDDDDI